MNLYMKNHHFDCVRRILLIQDGMQKDIFQNFVTKLEEHCEFVLIGSEIDYRRFIAQRSFDQVRLLTV